MFTVRVDNGPQPQRARRVYECARYEVTTIDQYSSTVTLYGPAEQPYTIDLADGGIAYFMNARGVTIDVLRTALKPAEQQQKGA